VALPRRADRYEAADVERAITEGWTESSTVEYKADPSLKPQDRRQLSLEQRLEIFVAKAASAFGNSAGGTLVLGVDEVQGTPRATTPPGIPRLLGRDRADERVDFMISRCLEPRPASAVHFAEIDAERAYVIVDVASRGGGPHRITNTSDPTLNGRYYMRRGRESVEADHFTLRALFAEAQEETARVREYLQRRGFTDDIDDPAFAQHEPARYLSDEGDRRAAGAMCVTIIPEVLRGGVLDFEQAEIRSLLKTGGTAGWLEERATLEGRMVFRAASTPPLVRAYFRVHRNGYIEAGDARVVAVESTANRKHVFVHAVAAVFDATLTQAAKLYAAIGTRDRLLVGLHLRDVADTNLGIRGTYPIHTDGHNMQRNVTIEELLPLEALTLPTTRVSFDRRVANAYGLDDGLVYNPDGTARKLWPF
jgi:hypothetical protein